MADGSNRLWSTSIYSPPRSSSLLWHFRFTHLNWSWKRPAKETLFLSTILSDHVMWENTYQITANNEMNINYLEVISIILSRSGFTDIFLTYSLLGESSMINFAPKRKTSWIWNFPACIYIHVYFLFLYHAIFYGKAAIFKKILINHLNLRFDN